jgi:D-alanyl-D-alanine carboxypeptidase
MPATLTGYVADQPLDFPPGSAYRYSNTDNIVVALFAEEATGLSYERVLDRLVLDPLAMRQTSLPLGFRLPTPFVHGYASNARGTREDFSEIINMSAIWASGGIVSAPLDTNRFVRAYAGGRLFGGAARAAQLEFRPGGGSDPPGPGQKPRVWRCSATGRDAAPSTGTPGTSRATPPSPRPRRTAAGPWRCSPAPSSTGIPS